MIKFATSNLYDLTSPYKSKGCFDLYGYLSYTYYKHPVRDWDVLFTMATILSANEVYKVVNYFLLVEN